PSPARWSAVSARARARPSARRPAVRSGSARAPTRASTNSSRSSTTACAAAATTSSTKRARELRKTPVARGGRGLCVTNGPGDTQRLRRPAVHVCSRPIKREHRLMGLTKIKTGENPPYDVNVVIEIPLGGNPVKYELDKVSGAMYVDRFLYTAMFY